MLEKSIFANTVCLKGLKSCFLEKKSSGGLSKCEEKISKMLISAFDIIVQPLKHTFEIRIFLRDFAHCA